MSLFLFLGGLASATPAFLDEGFVLTAPPSGNFAAGIGAPTVDYDVATGTYAMYFESPTPTIPAECSTSYAIGRATSPDGVHWTIDADPVIAPDLGTPGSPFHCVASQPAVVYDGATWHLFFSTASEPPGDGQPNTTTGIAYATSTNGVDFTVQAAPLIPYEGVSMGLSSAAIVDGVLYLVYVSRPDFQLAWLPLDGTSNWTLEKAPVLDHDDAGVWAIQWVLGPSLYCEDDQVNPFSLVFAGDDNANARSFGAASSADAHTWTFDAANPFTTGDLDYGSLNHWDVLEAGTETLLWYSKTDSSTGLKAIGYAATATSHPLTGPRMCPHPAPPDTGTTDSGTTDSTPPDDTAASADTGGLASDKGGCGCAAGPNAVWMGGVGLAGALVVVRRRRGAAGTARG